MLVLGHVDLGKLYHVVKCLVRWMTMLARITILLNTWNKGMVLGIMPIIGGYLTNGGKIVVHYGEGK